MTYFTNDHEWLTVDGDVATVGITRYAADALGDLVFVDVKPEGTVVAAAESAAVVESVKAASDIYAPVGGEVLETNPRLAAEPEIVNTDPEGEGWLFKLRVADAADLGKLLDRAAYDALVGAA
jgi:glycine cleavage system H protein